MGEKFHDKEKKTRYLARSSERHVVVGRDSANDMQYVCEIRAKMKRGQ